MKKTFYLALCFGVTLCNACNSPVKKEAAKTDSTAVVKETKATSPAATIAETPPFDDSKIAVSTKDVGKFPYLNAPENYRYNDIIKSDLEVVHMGINGKLSPLEGKTFKSNIYKNSDSDTNFNKTIVERAYQKAITDLGGVAVSSKILPGETERIGKTVLDKENGHSYAIIGDNDFTLANTKTYLIKTAKEHIWIELSFYENGGYIIVLQN